MSSPRKFFFRRFSGLFIFLGTTTTAIAGEWQQQTIPMAGITNYMREFCIKFQQDDEVQYRFESEHPVNFDIHYHPDNGTQFKVRKDVVTQLTGKFSSEATQAYCFTWRNKHELDLDWNITLHYTVEAKK